MISSAVLAGYGITVMVAFIIRSDVVDFQRRPWLWYDSLWVALWPAWLVRVIRRRFK